MKIKKILEYLGDSMIVDASDQVLGRISSEIAKILLKEKEVTVVNAEKIIVTGRPKEILERFRRKRCK